MTRYFVLFTALLFIAACSDNGKAAGSIGGPCYGDGTCDGTLTCVSDVCVDLTELNDSDQTDPTDQTDQSDIAIVDSDSPDDTLPDDTVDTDILPPDQSDSSDIEVADDTLITDDDDVVAECVDGTTEALDCDGAGKQIRTCTDGQWGPFGDCIDITQAVIDIAAASACADYYWADRGDAPLAYTTGMGLVFAGAFCHSDRSDVATVAAAKTADTEHDALAWYDQIFTDLGMSNAVDGADTLRHAYTLLIGLGMRESSGEHCCGRDMSASNVTADTAEAGLFQTSYNSHNFSDELDTLYEDWKINYNGVTDYKCLLAVFSEDVTCNAANWENYGTGEGVLFQELEKSCPIFAAEYAAFMLRVSGGSKGHYGPLRTRAAEVRPECDTMFADIQALIEANPFYCRFLLNY